MCRINEVLVKWETWTGTWIQHELIFLVTSYGDSEREPRPDLWANQHIMYLMNNFASALLHIPKSHQKTPSLLSVSVSSVTQSCLTLCDPMDFKTPDFPVHHQCPEPTHTHVHRVGDAIQLSHPLSSPSPPTFNLSKHQGLSQWVSSSHQVAKELEFQL